MSTSTTEPPPVGVPHLPPPPTPLPPTLLIVSLKLYFTPTCALQYLHSLLSPSNSVLPCDPSKILLALIPDHLTIYPCASILANYYANHENPTPLLLGAQDCFWETQQGAYTGAPPSPSSLHSLGISIVELGHAERRAIFHETDAEVARKAAAVVSQGMIPLVCVGEISAPGAVASAAVGTAVRECEVQIRAVLNAVPRDATMILAYEPVWAIGKAEPASVDHVAAVVQGIREVVKGTRHQGDLRVLYGGSAGPGLWGKGGLGKSVDGMFLGRFAHEIEGVRKVVREVEEWEGRS